MCGPVLGILGAALSAFGSIVQGQQAAAAAEMQAKAYEQQALADQQASAYEQQRERYRQDVLAAKARAQVGASGVALSGSPTEVLVENAGQGELDIAAIQYGSSLRQNQLKTQAAISRFQGKQEKFAGFINAATGVVSGLSQLYNPQRAAQFGQNPFANQTPYGGIY